MQVFQLQGAARRNLDLVVSVVSPEEWRYDQNDEAKLKNPECSPLLRKNLAPAFLQACAPLAVGNVQGHFLANILGGIFSNVLLASYRMGRD